MRRDFSPIFIFSFLGDNILRSRRFVDNFLTAEKSERELAGGHDSTVPNIATVYSLNALLMAFAQVNFVLAFALVNNHLHDVFVLVYNRWRIWTWSRMGQNQMQGTPKAGQSYMT